MADIEDLLWTVIYNQSDIMTALNKINESVLRLTRLLGNDPSRKKKTEPSGGTYGGRTKREECCDPS